MVFFFTSLLDRSKMYFFTRRTFFNIRCVNRLFKGSAQFEDTEMNRNSLIYVSPFQYVIYVILEIHYFCRTEDTPRDICAATRSEMNTTAWGREGIIVGPIAYLTIKAASNDNAPLNSLRGLIPSSSAGGDRRTVLFRFPFDGVY